MKAALHRSRLGVITVVITAVLAALHPVAAYGTTGGGSATADTQGSTISVSVSVTYDSSSGGAVTAAASSSSTTAHVAPICKYIPLATGKGFAEPETRRWWGMYDGDPTYGSMSDIIRDATAQDWKSHADDEQGMWYIISCSLAAAGSPETLEEAQTSFYGANPTVLWVDGGSPPPARFYISPEQLARSAWDAVTIPDPSISHNPSLGTSGATLVGYETWVWAEGTPISITAVATAGETTATVTATSSGLTLSAPAAQASCTGFGVRWTADAQDTDCSIVFTRSSALHGGTTPLTVSATYAASWDSNTGASGSLGHITTSSTTQVPVAEAQTLNTSEGH
ncbi:hypothetical protein [Actinomyces bowdenii]|uniref:hypothetical protein n=1 Tax=Actinomyces bowdenii TaxID=131109 RepID=UPI001D16D342|nr:hypothetical protein [Actinomyces bowdenii]